MPNCAMCGNSYGIMGGSKEPYTGHNLPICNNCGILFKNLEQAIKTANENEYELNKQELLNRISQTSPEYKDLVEKYLSDLDDKMKESIANRELNRNVDLEQELAFKRDSNIEYENTDRICPVCQNIIPSGQFTCFKCGYAIAKDFFTQEEKLHFLAAKKEQLRKNPLFEYTVEIIDDKLLTGKPGKSVLEDTIMRYALNGWRLHTVTVKELGKNQVLGINSTMHQTILYFERCIKDRE